MLCLKLVTARKFMVDGVKPYFMLLTLGQCSVSYQKCWICTELWPQSAVRLGWNLVDSFKAIERLFIFGFWNLFEFLTSSLWDLLLDLSIFEASCWVGAVFASMVSQFRSVSEVCSHFTMLRQLDLIPLLGFLLSWAVQRLQGFIFFIILLSGSLMRPPFRPEWLKLVSEPLQRQL